MEDDISHIESHPITVHEIFSWIFSFFFNSELLNIFQILKSIGHENGKRNIEIQGYKKKINFLVLTILGAKIHIVSTS